MALAQDAPRIADLNIPNNMQHNCTICPKNRKFKIFITICKTIAQYAQRIANLKYS
jgi:hypothetical protein